MTQKRTIKFLNIDGSYWGTSCVRKVIITDNNCKVYFKDRKTPAIFKDFYKVNFENKI